MTMPTTKREAYELIAQKHREIEAARRAYTEACAPAQAVYNAAVKPHSDIYRDVRSKLQDEVGEIASAHDILGISSFDTTAEEVQNSDETYWEASSWQDSNC